MFQHTMITAKKALFPIFYRNSRYYIMTFRFKVFETLLRNYNANLMEKFKVAKHLCFFSLSEIPITCFFSTSIFFNCKKSKL